MSSKRNESDTGTSSGRSLGGEPTWLDARALFYMHYKLLQEHGGAVGAADLGRLDSACARPRNRWEYEDPKPDIPALAATLAYGLAHNHCFVDGNKRIAFASILVFLRRNGMRLVADEPSAMAVIQELAAGNVDEEALSAWIRAESVPQPEFDGLNESAG